MGNVPPSGLSVPWSSNPHREHAPSPAVTTLVAACTRHAWTLPETPNNWNPYPTNQQIHNSWSHPHRNPCTVAPCPPSPPNRTAHTPNKQTVARMASIHDSNVHGEITTETHREKQLSWLFKFKSACLLKKGAKSGSRRRCRCFERFILRSERRRTVHNINSCTRKKADEYFCCSAVMRTAGQQCLRVPRSLLMVVEWQYANRSRQEERGNGCNRRF